ncbi:hypothetical protein B0T24DRAFT_615231 [Lasiosphaeria ovina]|uniref:Uncharacterized protein n=1 Tax=Lasiosphaeria ovina TaxID=92902 RepID=A0AAE0NF64_9PEZI|nr:hypothetical protein B0T24DRAFT_615231 [Lasiosphaeria ovina]
MPFGFACRLLLAFCMIFLISSLLMAVLKLAISLSVASTDFRNASYEAWAEDRVKLQLSPRSQMHGGETYATAAWRPVVRACAEAPIEDVGAGRQAVRQDSG